MHQPIGRYPPTISAPLATADNRDSGADIPIAADRMMHSTVTPAVEYVQLWTSYDMCYVTC